MADVTSAVHKVLNESCQCQITADSIDEESFACSEDSSNYVTYRTRLSGTSEQDSASLISLIEDWVATGPTIRVGGELLKVDKDCSPAISNFTDEECSSVGTTVSPSDITPAIVGGVVAFVVLLIITLIVMVVICLKSFSSKKTGK